MLRNWIQLYCITVKLNRIIFYYFTFNSEFHITWLCRFKFCSKNVSSFVLRILCEIGFKLPSSWHQQGASTNGVFIVIFKIEQNPSQNKHKNNQSMFVSQNPLHEVILISTYHLTLISLPPLSKARERWSKKEDYLTSR